VRGARLFPYQIPTSHRERYLLILAASFLLIGTLALALSQSPGGIRNTEYGIRLLFAICSFAGSFTVAHIFLNRYLPRRDPLLLPVAALLTGWSLLLIGRLAPNFLLRQTIWLLISTAVLLLVVRASDNLRWLRRFRYTWLFGGLALLAATLVFGVNPSGYGLRLWLGAWGVYFQPVELLKLLMIVYLASYLAERRELLISERWKLGPWQLPPLAYVGPLLAMLGLALVLLAWQQDLGAAMLFFFTFLAMLYLTTGQWQYVAAGLSLFVIVGLVGYQLSDRVAVRIDGWLNPWPDAADRTFQVVQSLLAFGAGGILGRGLGLGDPTYIPAVHTDFVFAAIGEEFGLTGTLAAIALYGVLLLRGFRIAVRTTRPFERFLAAGLTSGLVIQAWVIMAGNAKLAPIAGVTLPFVSYGGSSLLISFIVLGFLLRVSSGNWVPGGRANRATGKLAPTTTLPAYQPTNLPTHQPANLPAHRSTDSPLHRLARVLSLGLVLLAATCGYWAVACANALQTRDDNPRRVLYEQRILRGRILDRNEAVLADIEVMEDGRVERRYLIPEAVPPVGYASLRHGTGGIEAAFDVQLRGEAGRSAWQATWAELLHRPPRGSDVQLTLRRALQVQAQQALEARTGAVVLLDATNGEILAMASGPTFDPEHLEEEWEALSKDPAAPLVNRATQGLYQPGTAVQTIMMAEALYESIADLNTPVSDATAAIPINGTSLHCSVPLSEPYTPTLAAAYRAACPAPFADLGERLGADGLAEAIQRWGFTTPPSLTIPTESPEWSADMLSTTLAVRLEAIGQGKLTLSPLQMALVAATLANSGEMPAPHLALRVREPEGSWRQIPMPGRPHPILAPEIAQTVLNAWPAYDRDVKGHLGMAVAGEEQQPHAWFLGIAPAETPRYAVAVLIERALDSQEAAEIGTALLQAALE
jgi:cell division protein FtsW (lipid II flippase)/cell division protein FtsI/penicillin-binding protein 2